MLFLAQAISVIAGMPEWLDRADQSCKNIFFLGNLGDGEEIVCEMKVLFIIAYMQYTIGLQIYLLKKGYIDKVTESSLQAIKVSDDVAKWVIDF